MEVYVVQLLSLTKKVERQDGEVYVLSKILMKNEVVEVFESKAVYLQKLFEMIKEYENL